MHHPYHPDAIRAVTTPALFVPFPALRTDAWLRLKEQQGHPISRDRLERLDAPRPISGYTPRAVIDFVTRQALEPTRAAIRAHGLTPTGDDAA
ncbi:hypothetical protein [Pseudooceanicola atlanticus]|nr:hypothetical protein [Pseudooceanicola atlanticus]